MPLYHESNKHQPRFCSCHERAGHANTRRLTGGCARTAATAMAAAYSCGRPTMKAAVASALRWQPAAGCRQMEMHMCRPQHGPSLRLRQTHAGTAHCWAVHGALSRDACAYEQLTAARAGWCTGPADAALGFAATANGVKAQSTGLSGPWMQDVQHVCMGHCGA